MSVLVAVPDLFFAARIAATARALGVEVVSCLPAELAEHWRAGCFERVIVDLHGAAALEGVRSLRAAPGGAQAEIVGFYSHVDRALREAALAAGVSLALPRSAFTARLPALLAGGAAG